MQTSYSVSINYTTSSQSTGLKKPTIILF